MKKSVAFLLAVLMIPFMACCGDGGGGSDPVPQNWYKDLDGDGYSDGATLSSLERPEGYALPADLHALAGDCDDGNAGINPAADELCDAIDNNCDGSVDEGVKITYYLDADADGYGSPTGLTEACARPEGYVENSSDCDDSSPTANPGALESCDSIDNDCDGETDEGYSAILGQSCSEGIGMCARNGEHVCTEDGAGTICSAVPAQPGTEICDGFDNDCNGLADDSFTLDITGINPDKAEYRVGETVTLTAAGTQEPILWNALPSANVSLSVTVGDTTQMTFLNPGIVQVGVSTDLGCVSESHDFYAVCSQVSGTAISPQGEGYGINYGQPNMVWRVDANDDFGPDPYDQIDRVEFYVWPDPATETGSLYLGSDSAPPYCAFGDDGAGGCLGGDVTTWQTGWYDLEARVITKPYSCGAHQTSVWTVAYAGNCKMFFYDVFDTASPRPEWQGTCLNDGCDPAMSTFYNSGGRMVLELENGAASFGPYFVTQNPASVPVTLAEVFYQYALFYDSSPVGDSAIGLSTLSTAGYHFTVVGAPFIDTDGTVSYNMQMVYNTGGGDVNPAPTSGSGTVLKAPFYIETWMQENGLFYGYACDNTGRWTYWSTGITLPDTGTYYNGVILNGPSTYAASASGTVDFFYQTCY